MTRLARAGLTRTEVQAAPATPWGGHAPGRGPIRDLTPAHAPYAYVLVCKPGITEHGEHGTARVSERRVNPPRALARHCGRVEGQGLPRLGDANRSLNVVSAADPNQYPRGCDSLLGMLYFV